MNSAVHSKNVVPPWIAARKRRLALAIYVDVLLFSIPYTLIAAVLDATVAASQIPVRAIAIAAFAVLEYALLRSVRVTPGFYLLGIRYRWDVRSKRPMPFVEDAIRKAERWYTILLGVFLINSGVKGIGRWTQYHTPAPVFGFDLGLSGSIAHSVLLGFLAVAVGALALRLHRAAIPIGLLYVVVAIAGLVANRNIWPDWVAREVQNRRAFQGIAVREGEIEFMQDLFFPMAAATVGLVAAALLALRKRIATRSAL